MTALNYMPKASAGRHRPTRRHQRPGVVIRLQNPTQSVAFFERAELLSTRDGDEILPIEYDDNYVTVFPGETMEIRGTVPTQGVNPSWVRVAGYNTAPVTVPIR